MKQVKFFKSGEDIPESAKYLRSEYMTVRYEDDWTPMGTESYPIKEWRHIYELQEGPRPAQETSVGEDKDFNTYWTDPKSDGFIIKCYCDRVHDVRYQTTLVGEG